MATLETINLEHIPSTHSVHVAVYKDVQNADFLQQQLLSRNQEFEYAFIDASCVVSRLQVLAAVHKAIMIQSGGNMKTPNIHSEIISEAYRRFGIQPTSKDIVVVKVLISSPSSPSQTAESIAEHLTASIAGTPAPFTDETIAQSTDWAKVRKYYKLNSGVAVLDAFPKGAEGEEARRRELETLVLGGMALRGL